MLRISKREAGTYAIEDTDYLESNLTEYCDLRQLSSFCNIVQLQYIGTKTYDNHRMLHDIHLVLSGLNLVSKVNGKTISLTPNILYQRFIEFSPLLSPNATAWYFILVTLFYNAFSVELLESIRLDGYDLLSNSTLATISAQTSALQFMRKKAIVAITGYCSRRNSRFFLF